MLLLLGIAISIFFGAVYIITIWITSRPIPGGFHWIPLSAVSRNEYKIGDGILSFDGNVVPDGDSATFVIGMMYDASTTYYTRYYKDGQHVYYWDIEKPDGAHLVLISEADPNTFSIIFDDLPKDNLDIYAADHTNVYYNQWPIEQAGCHADPTSFKILFDTAGLPSGYVLDDRHVFYTGWPPPSYLPMIICLAGADPATFRLQFTDAGTFNGVAVDGHNTWIFGVRQETQRVINW